MKLIRRYLVTEVITASLFVFAALISLYTLLDMIRELKDFGQGNYRLPQILGYVLLSVLMLEVWLSSYLPRALAVARKRPEPVPAR